MNNQKNLGNNFYLLNGVIQHRFSSIYFCLKTKEGNFNPKAWLMERAILLNNKAEGV